MTFLKVFVPGAIGILIAFAIALLMSGCSGFSYCPDHGAAGYVTERPVVPFKVERGYNPWFVDGGPTTLTLHNPTASYLQYHVSCNPTTRFDYIDRGHIEWWTCLPPHSERRRLVEFMNIDALHQVCQAQTWPTTPSACIESKE